MWPNWLAASVFAARKLRPEAAGRHWIVLLINNNIAFKQVKLINEASAFGALIFFCFTAVTQVWQNAAMHVFRFDVVKEWPFFELRLLNDR